MMIRGLMSKASAALLLTASALALNTASANAADLGGNCCADLEERIAELEATTARKGNRKVSLEITGWVNEAAFFWDDGVEKNVYIGTNSLEQSRVQFNGKAKIDGDWSAGYRLELGIAGAPSNAFTQDNDSPAGGVTVRHSHWYLQSKTFGKFAVGLNGTATYHLLDDADGVNTRNYSDPEAAMVALGQFRLRTNGQGVNGTLANGRAWRDIASGDPNNDTFGQNSRRNVVRYDSPEFAGFTFTASWGEDDQAGAALTYKNKIGDFSLLGKVGYEHNTDDATNQCNNLADVDGEDCAWYGAAGTILHEPTGLFVYGAWGEQKDDAEDKQFANADGTDTLWYVQAGIERKFFPIGKSTIFGEYRQDDRGSNVAFATGDGSTNATFGNGDLRSADLEFWSAGVVQNIDAAAMDLYVIYRHSDGDLTLATGVNGIGRNKVELDDMDMVITGARIKF